MYERSRKIGISSGQSGKRWRSVPDYGVNLIRLWRKLKIKQGRCVIWISRMLGAETERNRVTAMKNQKPKVMRKGRRRGNKERRPEGTGDVCRRRRKCQYACVGG